MSTMMKTAVTHKDIVRTWIYAQPDGTKFKVKELAEELAVPPKAVSNVLGDLRPYGGWISKPNGDKRLEYSLNEAGVLAYQLKKDAPKGSPSAGAVHVKVDLITPTPAPAPVVAKVRRKVRSPLVRAIDDEIKGLEAKIKDLQKIRKDYE